MTNYYCSNCERYHDTIIDPPAGGGTCGRMPALPTINNGQALLAKLTEAKPWLRVALQSHVEWAEYTGRVGITYGNCGDREHHELWVGHYQGLLTAIEEAGL